MFVELIEYLVLVFVYSYFRQYDLGKKAINTAYLKSQQTQLKTFFYNLTDGIMIFT